MRKLLGIATFLIAWATLGLLAMGQLGAGLPYFNSAQNYQTKLQDQLNLALVDTTFPLSAQVSGRDAQITGLVSSEIERAAILAHVGAIDGLRTLRDATSLPPLADPFRIDLVKTDAGLRATGHTPTPQALDEALADFNTDLTFARPMPDQHWPGTVATAARALRLCALGQITLTGTDLVLTCDLSAQEEINALRAILANLPPNYRTDITTQLIPANPYIFGGKVSQSGETFHGYIPNEFTRGTYAGLIPDHIQNLTPKHGMPDAIWPSFTQKAITALRLMQVGVLNITNRHATFTGAVPTATTDAQLRALFTPLPPHYGVDFDIAILDDGFPGRLMLNWHHKSGGTLSGKSADGLNKSDITSALNLPDLQGNITLGWGGDRRIFLLRLAALGQHLHRLETAEITLWEQGISLSGVSMPRHNPQDLIIDLLSDLGAEAKVSITASPNTPHTGDLRTNPHSQRPEVFQNGFWIPQRKEP